MDYTTITHEKLEEYLSNYFQYNQNLKNVRNLDLINTRFFKAQKKAVDIIDSLRGFVRPLWREQTVLTGLLLGKTLTAISKEIGVSVATIYRDKRTILSDMFAQCEVQRVVCTR